MSHYDVAAGVDAFRTERFRQVNEEGYDYLHDLEKKPEELIAAGLCYVEFVLHELTGVSGDIPPFNWPWAPEDWKADEDELRLLEKGGALIAAGYDRLAYAWANPETDEEA